MLVNENWPQDDARLQAVCVTTEGMAFKDLRNAAIVALFLASGVTAAELRQLRVDDLDVHAERYCLRRQTRTSYCTAGAHRCFRGRRDARISRGAQPHSGADALAIHCDFGRQANGARYDAECVRLALRRADLSAADESPRLLRNTFGRRQLIAGKTNQQVSNLMGLSSHRTATRLRQTVIDERFDGGRDVQGPSIARSERLASRTIARILARGTITFSGSKSWSIVSGIVMVASASVDCGRKRGHIENSRR